MTTVEYVVVSHGMYGDFSVVRKEIYYETIAKFKTRAEAEGKAQELQEQE